MKIKNIIKINQKLNKIKEIYIIKIKNYDKD